MRCHRWVASRAIGVAAEEPRGRVLHREARVHHLVRIWPRDTLPHELPQHLTRKADVSSAWQQGKASHSLRNAGQAVFKREKGNIYMLVVGHVVHEDHSALVLPWRCRAPVAAVGSAKLLPVI